MTGPGCTCENCQPQWHPKELRRIQLPLESTKKCSACGKLGERLSICGSCGEQAYCNAQCQKKDWPSHKAACGKTDRIDLVSFYPLLAVLMEAHRYHPKRPVHLAMTHQIVNSPNPNVNNVCKFPDGSKATLVLLGKEMEMEYAVKHSKEWWPTAVSEKVSNKLARRFGSEFYLTPSIVAALVALAVEVYTTEYIPANDSYDGQMKRRVRLKYHNSPIADFGIVKGRADVTPQDRLVYFSVPDLEFTKGPDPEEHYWIYCRRFHPRLRDVLLQLLRDAFFVDRQFRQAAPRIQHETKRFSVLREATFMEGETFRFTRRYFSDSDAEVIYSFMDKVAERPTSEIERDLVITWVVDSSDVIMRNMMVREYLNFPAQPGIGIQGDPGETEGQSTKEDDDAWFKYMKNWNRKQRKGEITNEQLGEAFRRWEKKHKSKGQTA